ncbi:MAG: hypothetical protein O7F71_13570, partial [Gammaproteobacteria bacterium]|nr:hypothetical protein [Gammaproteobacteria bacterium]
MAQARSHYYHSNKSLIIRAMLKLPGHASLIIISWVAILFCGQALTAERQACNQDENSCGASVELSSEHRTAAVAARTAAVAGNDALAADYWHPRDALPTEIAVELPTYCSGAYLSPDFPHPLTIDDNTYPIETSARRLEYLLSG